MNTVKSLVRSDYSCMNIYSFLNLFTLFTRQAVKFKSTMLVFFLDGQNEVERIWYTEYACASFEAEHHWVDRSGEERIRIYSWSISLDQSSKDLSKKQKTNEQNSESN